MRESSKHPGFYFGRGDPPGGLVGTRARLSEFYSGREEVDLADWHPGYPPSLLHADRDPHSRSRLRPDYLALRLQPGTVELEWAAVEAKGTPSPLANLVHCPPLERAGA